MTSATNGTEKALQQSRDESQVPQQMGAYITCLIIAYTGVALRFLCRRMKRTSLGADDWLILVSLVSSTLTDQGLMICLWLTLTPTKFFTTAFVGINLALTRDGLGRHAKLITSVEFFALVGKPSPA